MTWIGVDLDGTLAYEADWRGIKHIVTLFHAQLETLREIEGGQSENFSRMWVLAMNNHQPKDHEVKNNESADRNGRSRFAKDQTGVSRYYVRASVRGVIGTQGHEKPRIIVVPKEINYERASRSHNNVQVAVNVTQCN